MQPHTIPATNGHDDWSTPGPSRAINVNTLRPEVEALCAKHKTTISAIEALPRGAGTRVVMMNGDDAADDAPRVRQERDRGQGRAGALGRSRRK